ncbi:MAG: hypothetical protein OHK003_10010 [Anaerolineales bacterium]
MSNLTLSLQITALGMGLVFGAILLLWLMMIILTALTSDKKNASDSAEEFPPTPSPSLTGRAELEQVALLAVAMALEEQHTSSAHPLELPPTAIVSAWQLGMRTRQMSDKGSFRKR